MTKRCCRLAAAVLLLLSLPLAQAGEVWKCTTQDGQTLLSDKPCPEQGRKLEGRQLQPNVVAAVRLPEPQPGEERQPAAPANVCPGDQELRNMETQANSRFMGPDEKAFLFDEIRRARQCSKGQGRYTAEDWRLSRAAQQAQANMSGRAEARARAEGMHSAADPLEGERIVRQRESEALAARNQARMERRRAQQPPIVPPCPAKPGSGPVAPCR